MESKPDKEAILNFYDKASKSFITQETTYVDRKAAVKAMDEYSVELRKANDEMGKILMERDGEIEQLKEEIAKLQSTNEYWKQRCEAAEYLLNGYYKEYSLTDADYQKWQQLKNQEPNA